MPMVVNTNIYSINAQRNLNKTQSLLQRSLQRLSSGLRINSAKDDAAGLAIATRMQAQIKGLAMAMKNANDGISLAQTAEGALDEYTAILQRMRELAVQSANDTNTGADRASLQKEVDQLKQELQRIANTTTFNEMTLLDGTFSAMSFHIGAYERQVINVDLASMRTDDVGSYEVKTATGDNTISAANQATTNYVAAQTLTIKGYLGEADVTVGDGDTAKDIAQAVNDKVDSTGVTATAITYAKITVSDADTFSFKIEGYGSATVTATVTATDLSNLAEAINAVAGTTGVSAILSDDKSSITLVNYQGEDIKFSDFSSDGSATIDVQGLAADGETASGAAVTLNDDDASHKIATVGGNVIFDSPKSYKISTDTTGSLFTAEDNASTLNAVSAVDISTKDGANDAIKIIDGALAVVSDLRAYLGAIQNRLESTIRNLASVHENISASRSRIMDADFAAETANLTKAQILQQAGTAVLAQANMIPQQALTLLQG